jgi:hypothetical protein
VGCATQSAKMKNSVFFFLFAFLVISLNCGFCFRSTIDISFLKSISSRNRYFGNFAGEQRLIGVPQTSSSTLYGFLGFDWGQKSSEKTSSTTTASSLAQKVAKSRATARSSERRNVESRKVKEEEEESDEMELEEDLAAGEERNVIKQKDPVKRLFRYILDFKKWFERNAIPASSSSLKTKGFTKTNRFKMDALIAFSLPPKARAYYFQHLLHRLSVELGIEEIEKFDYFKRYLNRLEDRIEELEGDCQIEGEEYQVWLKQHRESYRERGFVVPGAGKKKTKMLVDQQDDYLRRKARIAEEKKKKKEKEEEEELENDRNILEKGLQENEVPDRPEPVSSGFNPFKGDDDDDDENEGNDGGFGDGLDMEKLFKEIGIDGNSLRGNRKFSPFVAAPDDSSLYESDR